MQHQPTPTLAEQDKITDAGILGLLIHRDNQRPRSVEEIEREIGDPVAVADSLSRLYGGGLIHRLDDFVWATRAALMANAIRM